jgi:hypothetical protein
LHDISVRAGVPIVARMPVELDGFEQWPVRGMHVPTS